MGYAATARMALDPALMGPQAEKLAADLGQRVVGQDEAIRHIVSAYQTYLAGLNHPARPLASWLFLGPTGTGKTRVVEATAEALLGDARAMIKVDCSEFQHSHEIAKLIGSPPGYIGHRETKPLLSQRELDRHHTDDVKVSLVLLDEIEKASDALWHLLLGVLDKGQLRLGDNSKTDFSRAMIFLTSNLGAAQMQAMLSHGMGFATARTPQPETTQISRVGVEAARKRFTPEFLNRLDKIVVFQSLGQGELRRILELELGLVGERIRHTTPLSFRLSEAAKDHLLHEGTNQRYGARHLKRAIERLLVHPLANLIATEQIRAGDMLEIDFDPQLGRMAFECIREQRPQYGQFHTDGLEFSPESGVVAASTSIEHTASSEAVGQ